MSEPATTPLPAPLEALDAEMKLRYAVESAHSRFHIRPSEASAEALSVALAAWRANLPGAKPVPHWAGLQDPFALTIFLSQILANAGGTIKVAAFDPAILDGSYRGVFYQEDNPRSYVARLEDSNGKPVDCPVVEQEKN